MFEDVIYNKIPSNSFDLSHSRKFSTRMGMLVPVMCQEVVPGDYFNCQSEQLVRMAPQVAPIMDKVRVTTHYFYTPNRLVWEGFNDFIREPNDITNPSPYLSVGVGENLPQIAVGSVADYLGYPTGAFEAPRRFNVFPLAMYNLIYNEYYRDQNLQNEKSDQLLDGNNNLNNGAYDIKQCLTVAPYVRAWNKDYFTSALPEPQKGDPVTFPLSGTAEISYDANGQTAFKNRIDGTPIGDTPDLNISFYGGKMYTDSISSPDGSELTNIDNSSNLKADLSTAQSITVEDFRRAVRLQEWLEINARSGNRINEFIKNHYGVTPDDLRLDRPQYLGGGISNISFSEVLQTSSSDTTTPQGNMSGHGINVGNSRMFSQMFKEHGFIIGIMSIQPEATYFNPTQKWSVRLDPLDYLFPKFAQLGEQPVYNYEVKGDYGVDANEVFGWQSRYAEYRYQCSTVHGQFKTTLDFWHLARKFETDPVLNGEFIECRPTDRIFAVTDDGNDQLFVFMVNHVRARRPLPRYNIPTI